MKRFIKLAMIAFLCNISVKSFSQNLNPPVTLTKSEDGSFYLEKIIELPGMKKEDAYSKIKNWVVTHLKTGDNNIFFDDESKKTIATSTALIIADNGAANGQNVEFKLSFSFKDGKVKLNISELVYHGNFGTQGVRMDKPFDKLPYTKKINRKIYEDFDSKLLKINASVEATLKGEGEDNW